MLNTKDQFKWHSYQTFKDIESHYCLEDLGYLGEGLGYLEEGLGCLEEELGCLEG